MDSARSAVLLDQIQGGALDSTSSLATVLRHCILLGGAYGSDDLVGWAKRELNGYKPEDQLPDHRVVHVPLQFDAIVGTHQVECHPLASSELPAQVRAIVSERFEFRHGIGDLEALRDRAHQEGAVKLQTDAARDLAPLVSHIKGNGWNVLRVYSSVSAPALEGILSSTRNGLVELVGRLSAVQPTTGDRPTPAAVDAAVRQYIFSGEHQTVTLHHASATGAGATANVTHNEVPREPRVSRWRQLWQTAKLVGACAVGLATILALTYAIWRWP